MKEPKILKRLALRLGLPVKADDDFNTPEEMGQPLDLLDPSTDRRATNVNAAQQTPDTAQSPDLLDRAREQGWRTASTPDGGLAARGVLPEDVGAAGKPIIATGRAAGWEPQGQNTLPEGEEPLPGPGVPIRKTRVVPAPRSPEQPTRSPQEILVSEGAGPQQARPFEQVQLGAKKAPADTGLRGDDTKIAKKDPEGGDQGDAEMEDAQGSASRKLLAARLGRIFDRFASRTRSGRLQPNTAFYDSMEAEANSPVKDLLDRRARAQAVADKLHARQREGVMDTRYEGEQKEKQREFDTSQATQKAHFDAEQAGETRREAMERARLGLEGQRLALEKERSTTAKSDKSKEIQDRADQKALQGLGAATGKSAAGDVLYKLNEIESVAPGATTGTAKDVPGFTLKDKAMAMAPGGLGNRFTSKEGRDLRQDVLDLRDMLLRARSGAQINEQEYQRLSKIIGGDSVFESPDTLVHGLSTFRQAFRQTLKDKQVGYSRVLPQYEGTKYTDFGPEPDQRGGGAGGDPVVEQRQAPDGSMLGRTASGKVVRL